MRLFETTGKLNIHRSRLLCAALFAVAALSVDTACSANEDTERWSDLMMQASQANDQLDFNFAENLASQADREAKEVGPPAQYLTWTMLAELAERRGEYDKAIEWYQKCAKLPGFENTKIEASDVLDKSSKTAEADELRKGVPHSSEISGDPGKAMPYIQGAIRKYWSPEKNISSTFATVLFVATSTMKHPVGFVYQSSNNAVHDQNALDAINALPLAPVAQLFTVPVKVMFSFEYNFFANRYPTSPPKLKVLDERQYQYNKKLVAWQENKLGETHPEVAISLVNAADTLSKADHKNTEAVLKKAVEIWEKNGIVCIATSKAYQKYGEALLKSKKTDEAILYLRKALAIAKQRRADDSFEVGSCKRSLIAALKKNNPAEAKQLQTQLDKYKTKRAKK